MSMATSRTHTTVTETAIKADAATPSIRQICRAGILAGRSTKDIAAEIVRYHPNSAAASKSAKHIAWYRATMKKAGELPAAQ